MGLRGGPKQKTENGAAGGTCAAFNMDLNSITTRNFIVTEGTTRTKWGKLLNPVFSEDRLTLKKRRKKKSPFRSLENADHT